MTARPGNKVAEDQFKLLQDFYVAFTTVPETDPISARFEPRSYPGSEHVFEQ